MMIMHNPTPVLPAMRPSHAEMLRAFQNKDAGYDGVFFTAVRTTGIFCRPSCAARPKPENIEFFATIREALFAGYRPCKRCRPLESGGAPPKWVAELMRRVEEAPARKLSPAEWDKLDASPARARRWFREHLGMTFVEWSRGRRLSGAFTLLREGKPVDDAIWENGYSPSGFRDAFGKTFGSAPGLARGGDYIAVQMVETPLGPMVCGAVREGVCLLEFTDRRMLERNYETIQRRWDRAVLPASHPHLELLRDELHRYFTGALKGFTVPLASCGTPFQESVWAQLRRIPFGQTLSYDALARRIGSPTAMRAVARANGANRISILIPCHRVIGKDGHLTGYGGGVWRKRLLLELERTGTLPGDQ